MYLRVASKEPVAPSDPGFSVRTLLKQRRRQRQTRSCILGWTAEATSFPQTPNLAALLSHTAPQRLQRLRAARPPCRATFRSDGALTGGAASVEWKSDLDQGPTCDIAPVSHHLTSVRPTLLKQLSIGCSTTPIQKFLWTGKLYPFSPEK